MEKLQALAVLLPVIVAMFGAGLSVYNMYIEPDFEQGKYFEHASIDYGEFQNTLHVEVTPSGRQELIVGPIEALIKLRQKASLNPKIDGKPTVVLVEIRVKSELVPIYKYVVHVRDLPAPGLRTPEERDAILEHLRLDFKVLYEGNISYITDNGTVKVRKITQKDLDLITVPMIKEVLDSVCPIERDSNG